MNPPPLGSFLPLLLAVLRDGAPVLLFALGAVLGARFARGRPPAAGLATALAAGAATLLLLRQLWRAGTAGGENLATLLGIYLPTALLLALAARGPARAGVVSGVVAAARDLAFATALAVAVVVLNGLSLAVPAHPLVSAGLRLSFWVLLAEASAVPGDRSDVSSILRRLPYAALALALEPLAVLFGGAGNPLLSGADVGVLPIVNALLPGYLVPSLLCARFAVRGRAADPIAARITGVVAALLFLTWATFELRRLFHGAVLSGPLRPGEGLAIALIWLAGTAALIAALRLRRRRAISSRRSRSSPAR